MLKSKILYTDCLKEHTASLRTGTVFLRRARAEQVYGISESALKVPLGKAKVKFRLAFSG